MRREFYSNGEYYGDFVAGKRHGYGTYWYDNGEKYE